MGVTAVGRRAADAGDRPPRLMTNPKLLILDEATEGLAPLIREEIWSLSVDAQSTRANRCW